MRVLLQALLFSFIFVLCNTVLSGCAASWILAHKNEGKIIPQIGESKNIVDSKCGQPIETIDSNPENYKVRYKITIKDHPRFSHFEEDMIVFFDIATLGLTEIVFTPYVIGREVHRSGADYTVVVTYDRNDLVSRVENINPLK